MTDISILLEFWLKVTHFLIYRLPKQKISVNDVLQKLQKMSQNCKKWQNISFFVTKLSFFIQIQKSHFGILSQNCKNKVIHILASFVHNFIHKKNLL